MGPDRRRILSRDCRAGALGMGTDSRSGPQAGRLWPWRDGSHQRRVPVLKLSPRTAERHAPLRTVTPYCDTGPVFRSLALQYARVPLTVLVAVLDSGLRRKDERGDWPAD